MAGDSNGDGNVDLAAADQIRITTQLRAMGSPDSRVASVSSVLLTFYETTDAAESRIPDVDFADQLVSASASSLGWDGL